MEITNALELPDPHLIKHIEEPYCDLNVIVPEAYIDSVLNELINRRGEQKKMIDMLDGRIRLNFSIPLSEIISDFFDRLKSLTKGYGSMDFEFEGYREADIRRLTICLMGDPIDALSFLIHSKKAERSGRALVTKLKDKLPR